MDSFAAFSTSHDSHNFQMLYNCSLTPEDTVINRPVVHAVIFEQQNAYFARTWEISSVRLNSFHLWQVVLTAAGNELHRNHTSYAHVTRNKTTWRVARCFGILKKISPES